MLPAMDTKTPPRVFLPAILSGLLLFTAYFPLSLGWMAWFALVPFLTLIRADVRPRRLYFAAFVGDFGLLSSGDSVDAHGASRDVCDLDRSGDLLRHLLPDRALAHPNSISCPYTALDFGSCRLGWLRVFSCPLPNRFLVDGAYGYRASNRFRLVFSGL